MSRTIKFADVAYMDNGDKYITTINDTSAAISKTNNQLQILQKEIEKLKKKKTLKKIIVRIR